MEVPLEITFRNSPHIRRAAQQIETYAQGLTEFYERIVSCHVVVDVPHRHHESGNLYQVRIDLAVPGGEIVINREPSVQTDFKDLDAAISHAFDAAARKLEDYARLQRQEVKHHERAPHAKVARVFADRGYGFLLTPDEREIYFHQHSLVRGDFEHLKIGTEVTFVEELGDKGPQASTVKIVGRHNHL